MENVAAADEKPYLFKFEGHVMLASWHSAPRAAVYYLFVLPIVPRTQHGNTHSAEVKG